MFPASDRDKNYQKGAEGSSEFIFSIVPLCQNPKDQFWVVTPLSSVHEIVAGKTRWRTGHCAELEELYKTLNIPLVIQFQAFHVRVEHMQSSTTHSEQSGLDHFSLFPPLSLFTFILALLPYFFLVIFPALFLSLFLYISCFLSLYSSVILYFLAFVSYVLHYTLSLLILSGLYFPITYWLKSFINPQIHVTLRFDRQNSLYLS